MRVGGTPFTGRPVLGDLIISGSMELSIWSNGKSFEKTAFPTQRKPTQQRSQPCPTVFVTCSGLLDQPAVKLTAAAGWWAFAHSLTQIPTAEPA